MWPLDSLALGNNIYSASQLCSILNTPVNGNGLVALAHQLIAAKFNVANGADSSAIQSIIDAADTLIGNLIVGTDTLATSQTSALVTTLDNYNMGLTGPGHCSDSPPEPQVFASPTPAPSPTPLTGALTDIPVP